MIHRIISYLPLSAARDVAQVSRDFSHHAAHDNVWMERCVRMSDTAVRIRQHEPSWKSVFQKVSFGFLTDPDIPVRSKRLVKGGNVINHIEYGARKAFVSTDGGSVKVFDLDSRVEVQSFDNHPRYVMYSQFARCRSATGNRTEDYLLTACYDGNTFNATTKELVRSMTLHTSHALALRLIDYVHPRATVEPDVPSMTFVSSGADGTISICDVATGQKLASFVEDDWIMSLHVSTLPSQDGPKTKLLAGSHNGTVWEFDVASLEKTGTWKLNACSVRRFAPTLVVAGAGAGNYHWDVIVSNAAGFLERWKLRAGSPPEMLWRHKQDVWAVVCMGPRHVVSGCQGGEIVVREVAEGNVVKTLDRNSDVPAHTTRVRALHYVSEFGQLLSGGEDNTCITWSWSM